MARRGGFLAAMERLAREQARHQRLAAAEMRRVERDRVRMERERIRLQLQLDKAQRQLYLANRMQEAELATADAAAVISELRSILQHTLAIDDTIPFSSLHLNLDIKPFELPAELATSTPLPDRASFLSKVRKPNFFEKLFSLTRRYQAELQHAETEYEAAMAKFEMAEGERKSRIEESRSQYALECDRHREEVRQRNLEVDELETAYRSADPQAIVAYSSMVLERSEYPEEFPQQFRMAYVSASRELVIDYEIPSHEIVPLVSEFRYVKSKDVIEEKPRKATEVRDVYQDVVASVALRTIHEIFEADQQAHIDVVVFNGFVNTVDPATGSDIKPYLISVRTTKDRFATLDLSRIDKKACLRNLGAQVSPQPTELQAVKPIIEFDMVDRRYVEGGDVLSDLESRPNLLDLSPFEFEQLVGNVFSKMGLETKQTRSSRDGGVDVVAYDTRPVIGGKVVIQAKRYRHTVGVSAVRDLFGTMSHEGANKGILVSTSGYGPDAYDFTRGKPIELIDGAGLLYYLEQHAGIRARIVFPSER